MKDIKNILSQAEALLLQAAGTSGLQAADLREKAMVLLEQVKAQTLAFEEEAVQKAQAAGNVTKEYVKENPWQALGVAAGLGLLLGAMLKGGDKHSEKDITP